MKKPAGHPWRVTLMRMHQSLLEGGSSTASEWSAQAACTWSALADDSTGPEQGEGDLRIWGRYSIGNTDTSCWWEAIFTDTAVIVSEDGEQVYVIPYSDMGSIVLPAKLSEPCKAIYEGLTILYDESSIQGLSGRTYPVRGAVVLHPDGMPYRRDLFSWSTVVRGANRDRERQQREAEDA